MLFPLNVVLILGIIQFQLCDSFPQNNEQIITNSTWATAVVPKPLNSAQHQPTGFNPENVEERVEAVEQTFEAKTEAWINRKNYRDPASESGNRSSWDQEAGFGTFAIVAICFPCCLCLVALCEKYCKDSNPSPNRHYNHSPRAYRIQTQSSRLQQSSGLRESHLAAPTRDFTANMFTNSNDQEIERSSSSSEGRATVTASAPPPPVSHGPHPYRIQTYYSALPPASSTDQSAHEHQVRRNLTPSPCPSQRLVAIANEDELPPSYDQCILTPTTIPDAYVNATAPPEENEERLPPYIFK